jgi:hypothetical protein
MAPACGGPKRIYFVFTLAHSIIALDKCTLCHGQGRERNYRRIKALGRRQWTGKLRTFFLSSIDTRVSRFNLNAVKFY